jgi:hypothetical protein
VCVVCVYACSADESAASSMEEAAPSALSSLKELIASAELDQAALVSRE